MLRIAELSLDFSFRVRLSAIIFGINKLRSKFSQFLVYRFARKMRKYTKHHHEKNHIPVEERGNGQRRDYAVVQLIFQLWNSSGYRANLPKWFEFSKKICTEKVFSLTVKFHSPTKAMKSPRILGHTQVEGWNTSMIGRIESGRNGT